MTEQQLWMVSIWSQISRYYSKIQNMKAVIPTELLQSSTMQFLDKKWNF